METNFLKLYLEENKTLAKTLVVKSQTSIDVINDRIMLLYGKAAVDSYDPTSWKYYKNITGEYHSLDKSMVITSLDTLEDIVFSKANLAIHTTTAKEYRYGSRYYYSLLERFPEQEQLILGILYPCDINIAINSDDGAILSYPAYLVEPQELTLIDELERFIKGYLVRWNVQAFGLSDNLYNTAQHALMYLAILPRLLNLRLKRCHTNEVHSFHVQQYLASHGHLDRYLPYMTLKQALYLYRNIRYIERNSGKAEQFKALVDHLLTERRIPLNEFSVRQLATFDDHYYNDITIRRKAVNPQYNIPEKDYFELSKLFDKERPLVYGNAQYLEDHDLKIQRKLQNSNSSVLQSKDLESTMIDYNDSFPDTLQMVLLRQWAYMSQKGYYNASITFRDPKTLQSQILNVDDAFIYFCYVNLKSIGINITALPNFINLKQRKRVIPNYITLLQIVKNDDLTSTAQRLVTGQPMMTVKHSVSSFFDFCNTLYQETLYHWYLISNTHDLEHRGYISNMIYSLYEDENLLLSSGDMPIDQWLYNKNLPTYNYDYTQAQELSKELFAKATGLTVDNTKLLKNIQRALVSALRQLSSYSVQFITEINASRITPVPWAAIRTGNVKCYQQQTPYIEINTEVIDVKGTANTEYKIESVVDKNYIDIVTREHTNIRVDTKTNLIHYQKLTKSYELYFSSYRIMSNNVLDDNSLMIGGYTYDQLTLEQQQSIKTLYN